MLFFAFSCLQRQEPVTPEGRERIRNQTHIRKMEPLFSPRSIVIQSTGALQCVCVMYMMRRRCRMKGDAAVCTRPSGSISFSEGGREGRGGKQRYTLGIYEECFVLSTPPHSDRCRSTATCNRSSFPRYFVRQVTPTVIPSWHSFALYSVRTPSTRERNIRYFTSMMSR